MGKITDALKKVTDERFARIQKKPEIQYVVRKVENTRIDDHVVSFHDPRSPVGEQYKILRTNIKTLKFTKDLKTFVITSAVNREGKSITAINLAIALAQDLSGKSVVLIDADMRKGTIAKYFGIERIPGLSEVLKGEISEEKVFVNPCIENLTVIPAGHVPRNPSELLHSQRMEKLISNLKKSFDYVLLDSPPVMPVTDACILGAMAEGVIIVVQSGRTQRDVIKHAESRLYQAGAKTLGYIITNVEYHVPRYLHRYVHEYGYYDSYYKDREAELEPQLVEKTTEVANS